jgi:predicted nucleic acid-binding protein
MKSKSARGIIADTGFWIALYDKRDERHSSAVSIMSAMSEGRFFFPWPLY